MADYPTSSYGPQDALKAYQDILASEKRKKKYATLIDGMMRLSPRYSGSAAATANRNLINSYGGSGSKGFATYSRLQSEAANAELDKFFMQDFLKQDFPNVASVRAWGATMGPEMTQARLAKYIELYTKRASEERSAATFDMNREDWLKGKAVAKLTSDLVDKYTDQYRNRTAEDQEIVIARIQDEIRANDEIPSTAKQALLSSVVKELTDLMGERGASLAKKVALEKLAKDAEKDQWRFERDQQQEVDRQAKYGREKEVAALDRTKGRLTARLAEKAANLWQANKSTMSREEALQTVLDESEELYTTTTAIEARMGVRDALEKLIGKDEDVTPTSGLKITEEMYSLLADTGNPEENLMNARKAFESENRRGASLNPAWYDYGVKKGYAIAADNFVRVLSMADGNRYSALMSLMPEFIETIGPISKEIKESKKPEDIEFIRKKEAEAVEFIKDKEKKLGVPYMVIEYILFPEEYAWGTK